jgi:hypothetical protein
VCNISCKDTNHHLKLFVEAEGVFFIPLQCTYLKSDTHLFAMWPKEPHMQGLKLSLLFWFHIGFLRDFLSHNQHIPYMPDNGKFTILIM